MARICKRWTWSRWSWSGRGRWGWSMWGCGRCSGCRLGRLLEGLGFNGRQRAVAVGSIIGRMAQPGSERASWRWLCERSGLGELLEVDFEAMSLMRLYRVPDALMAHREAIEQHLFEQVTELFGLGHTVTLYDLTNTFFEGEAKDTAQGPAGALEREAQRLCAADPGAGAGRFGFRGADSEVFAGRVDEDKTLEAIIKALGSARRRPGGDGCGDCHRGQRGLVARQRLPLSGGQPPTHPSLRPRTVHGHRDPVSPQGSSAHRWLDEDRGEVRLYCYSEERAKKGGRDRQTLRRALRERVAQAPRGAVAAPHPQGARLRHRSGSGGSRSAAAAPGSITPWKSSPTRTAELAVASSPGSPSPLPALCSTHPGVYCLRSNVHELGSTDLVAHLHHAHRTGSRVPLTQVRTRPPPHLATNLAEPLRRTPVHRPSSPTNWSRPSAGASPNTDLNASWTTLQSYPRRPAPCHRILPPKGWPHPPRPQGHPCRATTTQNLHRSRSPPSHSRCHQIDRLGDLN